MTEKMKKRVIDWPEDMVPLAKDDNTDEHAYR